MCVCVRSSFRLSSSHRNEVSEDEHTPLSCFSRDMADLPSFFALAFALAFAPVLSFELNKLNNLRVHMADQTLHAQLVDAATNPTIPTQGSK